MQEGTTWRPSITAWMPNDSLCAEKPRETVCYAFVPRPRRPVTPAGGKVVDFTAYRQAARPEEHAPQEEAPGRPRPVRRRRTLALTVDLVATGAVVVLLAAVVLRFFAG